jgi:peptidoglycan hydrolase-like protein with peptidoglycan-binding domain
MGVVVINLRKFAAAWLSILSLLLLAPANSSAIANIQKRKARSLNRAEIMQAEARLSEMGYGTGRVDGVIDGATRNALLAFQKWERRKVTGRLSREDLVAIMSADAPQPKDPGYGHVEVDLDRQVLLLTDSDGTVRRVLPVSTGSNKRYRENG